MPVLGFGTDRCAGFYLADSGHPVPWRVDDAGRGGRRPARPARAGPPAGRRGGQPAARRTSRWTRPCTTACSPRRSTAAEAAGRDRQGRRPRSCSAASTRGTGGESLRANVAPGAAQRGAGGAHRGGARGVSARAASWSARRRHDRRASPRVDRPAGAGQRHARPRSACARGGSARQHGRVARAPAACRSSFVGCVGDDAVGRRGGRAALRAAGRRRRDLAVAPGAATGACVVLVDAAGERTMLPDAGANAAAARAPPGAAAGRRTCTCRATPCCGPAAGRRRSPPWPAAREAGMTTSVDPASAAPLADAGRRRVPAPRARRRHGRRDPDEAEVLCGARDPRAVAAALLPGYARGGAEARRGRRRVAGRRRRAAARRPGRGAARAGRGHAPARATRSRPAGSRPAARGGSPRPPCARGLRPRPRRRGHAAGGAPAGLSRALSALRSCIVSTTTRSVTSRWPISRSSQGPRDDPGHPAAGGHRRVRHRAHQAHRAAAVDELQAAPRDRPPERRPRPRAKAGSAPGLDPA